MDNENNGRFFGPGATPKGIMLAVLGMASGMGAAPELAHLPVKFRSRAVAMALIFIIAIAVAAHNR
jgi:hypothetical protein